MMDHPLSSTEIQSWLPDMPVIKYEDFSKLRDINQLLGKTGACVFLYETKPGYGHWCCLFRRSASTVEVFDSYGYVPDDELNLINRHFRRHSKQDRPYLLRLLDKSGYRTEYNNHHLQSHAKGIATCGRHCIARLLHRHISIDQYARRLQALERKTGMTPDEYVTELIKLPVQ
jgi:hypothetical protein